MTAIPSVERVKSELENLTMPLQGLKSERVIGELEKRILSGDWPPGTLLPTEAELSVALGVSRSVIRDSVRALVARGVLTTRAGRGTFVAESDNPAFSDALVILLARSGLTVGEINAARAHIEGAAAATAATAATAKDLEKLEHTYQEFAQAAATDAPNAATLHTKFHIQILEATHLPALTLILRPLTEIITLTTAGSVRPNGQGEWEVEAHLPILQAIRERDPSAASRASREHFATNFTSDQFDAVNKRKFSEIYFLLKS